MKNIKIAKREITIEKFQFEYTYRGLIIGSPNQVINDKIISDYQNSLKKGNRKSIFHFTNNDYVSKDTLKPVIYSAFLESEPINDIENQYDGSWLVVSWFGDEQIEKSISEIITKGLAGLKYDKLAENFTF
ncbi:conserved hypothetical protein [Flavobacterium sp. 9R]|uniref:hypothetical protein n=1 Tax=Flavobacterium sp. 9R TaxID=2653143 RepID=UPI0012F43E8D|nr:hypothetical protein [Flavobacterium sp. 9R]VXB46971.1 conserved hypothetical protein [Flavobacterium sp. 9R]